MLKTSTLAPWIALLALSCADLRTLSRNQCGNGIIELGEDCDGVGIGKSKCSSACRLLCTSDNGCPSGWGCGADQICRQPKGEYEPFGATLGLSADRLTLADFDGDGRSDVLATRGSTFSIAYLDPSGLQSKTTTVSFAAEGARGDVPAAGNIDPDRQADIAFRLRDGLAIMRGQPDRTLTANAYSGSLDEEIGKDDILLSADIDTRLDAPGEEVLAIRDDGLYVVHTTHPSGPPGARILAWESGHGPVAGKVPLGGFGQNGNGRDFVFAFQGDSKVTVFEPLVPTFDSVTGTTSFEWNVDGGLLPPTVITLPAGAKVTDGVFITPAFNASQAQGRDIVVSGEDDKGVPSLYVAYYVVDQATNTRGFTSTPTLPVTLDNKASLYTRLEETGVAAGPGLAQAPLFVGDFNFDETLDIITPSGVYMSRCDVPPLYCTAPGQARYRLVAKPDTEAGWTSAIGTSAGQSNSGLNFANIYVASSEPGLTYLRGTVSGTFSTLAFDIFRIPTQNAVKNLAFADFDGDGAQDLAFSQLSARDASLESLHVSFGSALGIPTAPVDLGDLGRVDQITAARLVSRGAFEKGASDLAIRATTDGAPVLYRFDGSADRQVQSPIKLTTPCDATATNVASLGVPRAMSMGLFDAKDGKDIAVLYETPSGGYALWSIDPSKRITSDICTAKIGPGELDDLGSGELTMMPVDLDGDGRDEVLILPTGAPKLIHAKIGEDGQWAIDTIDLGASYVGITTADLGARAAGAKAALDVIVWSNDGVQILWNDGAGKLSASASGSIEMSKLTCDGDDGASVEAGIPLGVAALNMDDDGEKEIVIVTASVTLTVDFEDAAKRKLRAPKCAEKPLAGGGQAVTTGDVDGNGVTDLVIARPGGIQVFVGTPVVK